MATFRSIKNIALQGDGEPHVVGEFDYETREYVYNLSADDAAEYGPALVAEGAVQVADEAPAAVEAAPPDAPVEVPSADEDPDE
jgi:hypothetical protein